MPADRYVIERSVIRDEGGNAISMEIKASGAALQLFSASDRNALIRDAMWQGGDYWRLTFLPLRFDNYAKRLGYHVGAKYNKAKLNKYGHQIPLVLTGQSQDTVLGSSKVEARATSNTYWAKIRFRFGDRISYSKIGVAVLRSLHPDEVVRVAKVVASAMAGNLANAYSSLRGKAMLSPAHKFAIDRRSKSRQSPGTNPRRGPRQTARRMS